MSKVKTSLQATMPYNDKVKLNKIAMNKEYRYYIVLWTTVVLIGIKTDISSKKF